MPWFQFHDMHSGGGQKLDYGMLFIEATDQAEAEAIFTTRFGRDPHNVTCECCGEDYSINESPSLRQATGYERRCQPLITPRGPDGRWVNVEDPWFHENFWTEPGQEIKEPYQVDKSPRWGDYVPLEEYVKSEGVFVLSAEQRAKESA